jgi:hypothetical protein
MTSANALKLSDVKDVVSLLGTATTMLAVIVGGLWAYFKFVRGRTYRPRLSVRMLAQWRLVDGRHLLHARVIVKNIGASVVTLRRRGTGLRVSVLSPRQPDAPAAASWEVVRVFEILSEHQWIEAGETVSDDQLINMDPVQPQMTLFETRLVWSWSGHKKEIVVVAREVVPPDATMDNASS